jgi:hypothetical protein
MFTPSSASRTASIFRFVIFIISDLLLGLRLSQAFGIWSSLRTTNEQKQCRSTKNTDGDTLVMPRVELDYRQQQRPFMENDSCWYIGRGGSTSQISLYVKGVTDDIYHVEIIKLRWHNVKTSMPFPLTLFSQSAMQCNAMKSNAINTQYS